METETIPVADATDIPDECSPLFLFSFGAYGWTKVYAFANAGRGIESALENAAGWLADNAPGHLSEPDYSEAAEDLGYTMQDGEDSEEVMAEISVAAEQDMTYTESGWLNSAEWLVDEVFDTAVHAACRARFDAAYCPS